MQKLVYIQFISIFFLDFLEKYRLIPRQLTWFPDLLSAITLVIVILLIIKKRTINISITYWIVFAVLLLHIIFGIITNDVPTGAIFQGIRVYLKYIPFFLLPIAYRFSEIEIRKQLILLVSLTLMQLPISLYQRFVGGGWSATATGDYVIGSFETSSQLSIFLICAFSMCLAFYFKKRISAKTLLVLCIALLLPTTINETKGTLFLLPVGLIVPALMSGTLRQKIRRLFGSILIGLIFMTAFATIYDTYMSKRYGENAILSFFTTKDRLEGYLAPQSSGLRTNLGPGKVDVLVNFFTELSDDPTKLAFGLGIGNLSKSFLGDRFSGEYMEKYGGYIFTAIAQLLWELGIIGTFLTLLLWFLIFKDAKNTMSNEGITGAIALGLIGILGVFTLAIFYKNILQSNIISYVFWYYAGYIAAKGKETEWRKRFS